jgi:hypothetical protein
VEASAIQQAIIQATYEVFRDSGRWPTVDAIDRLADERLEADGYALLESLPSSLAAVDRLHLARERGRTPERADDRFSGGRVRCARRQP